MYNHHFDSCCCLYKPVWEISLRLILLKFGISVWQSSFCQYQRLVVKNTTSHSVRQPQDPALRVCVSGSWRRWWRACDWEPCRPGTWPGKTRSLRTIWNEKPTELGDRREKVSQNKGSPVPFLTLLPGVTRCSHWFGSFIICAQGPLLWAWLVRELPLKEKVGSGRPLYRSGCSSFQTWVRISVQALLT